MAKDLKNKVAVITGGAVGIGLEIADKFLQKGAKLIIILDINVNQGTEAGTEAVKNLNSKYGNKKSVFIECNVVTDVEAVSKNVIKTYKQVDILVNNAGILDEASARKTIDVNVTALIEFSLKFFDHMRKDKDGKGGTVMNLASIYGFRVDPYLPVYQASKFAVMGFTRSLGHSFNYERTGVRVVAINPGFTRTALISEPKTTKDATLQEEFEKFLERQAWQDVDAVGNAAVEIFESAESGTAWLIEGGRPVVEIK